MPIDYSKYPPNWKAEIRPAILKRANNTCENERCRFKHLEIVWSVESFKTGRFIWVKDFNDAVKISRKEGWSLAEEIMVQDKIIKPVKVVLTIAHLDHDESNFNVSMDRLMAMCQLHHIQYDYEEKQRRTNLKRNDRLR